MNKKALYIALFTVAVGIGVVFGSLFMRDAGTGIKTAKPDAILVPAPFVGPRDKAQAMKDLMALPELQAWSEHLKTSSGGTIHGALIEYGPTPKTINGKKYWQLSYVENTPDAAHRWESFLVGEDTPEILVEDDENAQPITLEQWRQAKNPIARKSAQ